MPIMMMSQTLNTHLNRVLHVKAAIPAQLAYWVSAQMAPCRRGFESGDNVTLQHIFCHAHIPTLVCTSVRMAYTSVCVVVPYVHHSAPLAPCGHLGMVPSSIFWPKQNVMHH